MYWIAMKCRAVLLLLLAGCSMLITASDRTNIEYTFEGNGPGVLLLHMLNSNRQSWQSFAKKLNDAGFSTLAIDFRGHGDSDGRWTTFTEKDFADMKLDIEAAKSFLDKQGISLAAVVGASIGANHALRFAAKNPVKAVVLLSPGLDYRGVKTQEVISEVQQPLLIIAAEGDVYSAQSSRTLHQTHGTMKLQKGDAHGTRMLDETLMNDIVSWLKENAK